MWPCSLPHDIWPCVILKGQSVCSRLYFIRHASYNLCLLITHLGGNMTFQFTSWHLIWFYFGKSLTWISSHNNDLVRTKEVIQSNVQTESTFTWLQLWGTFHMNWHKLWLHMTSWGLGEWFCSMFELTLTLPHFTFVNFSCVLWQIMTIYLFLVLLKIHIAFSGIDNYWTRQDISTYIILDQSIMINRIKCLGEI